MKKTIAIGTDIGGSHISCAAIDLISGKILRDTLTVKTVDNQSKANVIISIWSDTISEVFARVPSDQVKGIGFAMPGPFDYVNGICYIRGVAKYENLYGFNISDAISSSLDFPSEFPVRFMNDASAFAVGEAWSGKAAGAIKSVSVTLGTGFGSAFISNRIPIVDETVVPKKGCIYHLPYGDGIADDYFSTRGLLGRYRIQTGSGLHDVKELASLATGNKIVSELFLDFGEKLGQFLAPWLVKFGAEVLVIGGNISNAYNLFGEGLENRLIRENCNCKVALSELKEDAALLGSAFLLDDEFWNSVQPALRLM